MKRPEEDDGASSDSHTSLCPYRLSDGTRTAYAVFYSQVPVLSGEDHSRRDSREQIVHLKFMLKQADALVELILCIVRGSLKGLEGELCKSMFEKLMVAIRIDGLGYVCVSVSVRDSDNN